MKTELTKITDYDKLLDILSENRRVKNLDLTQFDFSKEPFDFSGKWLENVVFSNTEIPNATLTDIDFSNTKLFDCKFEKSTLTDCKFSNSRIDNCDFTEAKISTNEKRRHIEKVKYASFKGAEIYNTKFRNAKVDICDFRYASITDSTLQNAHFKFTDFYRTAFKGITVFQDAKIESCSLNYVSFETFCITQSNLVKNKKKGTTLVQENEEEFKKFLNYWIRFDTTGNDMSKPIDEGSVSNRYKEAERIYRQFSAMWENKGYNKDAEWAYVQAKRMERKYLLQHIRTVKKCKDKCSLAYKISWNWICDYFFGYGVRLLNILITYAVLIVTFGFIYKCMLAGQNQGIGTCMVLSINNAIGGGSCLTPPMVELLSILQTGLGMLLTGFLGFVVANKIRKS
jgi:uncharacterized protein YjbI with pentapeptide repeats